MENGEDNRIRNGYTLGRTIAKTYTTTAQEPSIYTCSEPNTIKDLPWQEATLK